MSEILWPEQITEIRESLGLTKAAAGLLIGGGPRAFWKYESGNVTPSLAMSQFLRILHRHPGLVEELKEAHTVTNETRVVNRRHEPYDVYIGRPSVWGNPYKIGRDGSREEVIAKYREYIIGQIEGGLSLEPLRGKVMGCYCKPDACHGDVLMELLKDDAADALQ